MFFKNNRSIGYSVQTAFHKGVDKSYEAVQSVTKACEYFSQKINERKNTCAFYFPILLIEGRLFEGKLANDEIEIEEVKNCLLYTSPSPRDQRGSRMPSSA